MIDSRIRVIMTHCVTQMIHRWLPCEPCDEKIAIDYSDSPWEDLAIEICSEPDLLWRDFFLRRFNPEDLGKTVRDHLQSVARAGGWILCIGDSEYPENLAALSDPPLMLTGLGDKSVFSKQRVAIVGARKGSAWALSQSFKLGRELANLGMAVVSGGAFGCDITSHHGVYASDVIPAPAISVFAGGLHTFYPQANTRIFAMLKKRQAVFLSERLWTAPALPHDFVVRNRIISGLSDAILVMQAAERSGALATARLGLDQGRDVYILRHPEGDVRAEGGAKMLEEGAKGFCSAESWLAECCLHINAMPEDLTAVELKTLKI